MSEPINESLECALTAEIKLYYDLYVPGGAPERRPLLIALHGYGSNKEWMMRVARMFAPDDFAIAALQGLHQHLKEPKEEGGPLRYGFGWVTNFHAEESIRLHHRALLDLIGALVEQEVAHPARVFLMGFSQSVALNYRFTFTHRERLRGVVGICGGLPGDWEAGPQYGQTEAAVLHLTGTQDEFYPPARTSDYASRLLERAHDVEVKSYQAGHEIVPAMMDDVRAWLERHAAF